MLQVEVIFVWQISYPPAKGASQGNYFLLKILIPPFLLRLQRDNFWRKKIILGRFIPSFYSSNTFMLLFLSIYKVSMIYCGHRVPHETYLHWLILKYCDMIVVIYILSFLKWHISLCKKNIPIVVFAVDQNT